MKEYKDKIFAIDLTAIGDNFENATVKYFTGSAKTGDYSRANSGVRFYAKVVGVEDPHNLKRDWGMDLEDFKNGKAISTNRIRYWLSNIVTKVLFKINFIYLWFFLPNLRQKTRLGDRKAVVERLKHLNI